MACARKALAARDEEIERLRGELDQANDALLTAREAAGKDDRPFLDDTVGALKAERDALKLRVAELERERDGARDERNGIISRLRLKWPHIEIGERGKRRDPGPPTCLRCAIEDMIGEPYHDGLGPPRGESNDA